MTRKRRAESIFRALWWAALVVIAQAGGTVAAQSAEPKTVADFFLLVPDRYTGGYDLRLREGMLRGERRGVVVDVRNGYISYDASDNPSGFEFAVFRKSNGQYLVAFSTGAFSDPDMDKELGSWPTLFLLSYERGRWRDVTVSSLPAGFDRKLYYSLPRRGTSLGVWDGESRHYTLAWRNDRFRLARRARR